MVADLPIEVPRAQRSPGCVSSIAERIRATRLTTL
jgi:hypothetical protein